MRFALSYKSGKEKYVFLLWDFSCLPALQPSCFPSLHVLPLSPLRLAFLFNFNAEVLSYGGYY